MAVATVRVDIVVGTPARARRVVPPGSSLLSCKREPSAELFYPSPMCEISRANARGSTAVVAMAVAVALLPRRGLVRFFGAFGSRAHGRNNPTACTLTSEGLKDNGGAGRPSASSALWGAGGETGGSLEARTSDIVCIKREFLRNPRFNPPLTVAPDASMP